MKNGKPIPIWFTEENRRRVEAAAALAGYSHVSTYIRDKTLGDGGHRSSSHDDIGAWAERQELGGRLDLIERSQMETHALLAMLLFLVQKRATTGDVNDLILAGRNASEPIDVITACAPKLAALLARFNGQAS